MTQASSSISVNNPFEFNNMGQYGVQPFDCKFTYTLLALYQEPWFKGQQGFLGRILGGWSVAPLFTARSGFPIEINDGTDNAFGETGDQSGVYEEAAGALPFSGGYAGEGNYNYQNAGTVIGSTGNPAKGGTGINIFNNPVQVASEFRPSVLGLDVGQSGGAGVIRGFPYWNLDATLSKKFRITERFDGTLIIQSVNLLNHFVPGNPSPEHRDGALLIWRGDQSVHYRKRHPVALDGVRSSDRVLRQG